MNLIQGLIDSLKLVAEQIGGLANWFTSELVQINGVSITPLTIILPSALLVILGYIIIRFLII